MSDFLCSRFDNAMKFQFSQNSEIFFKTNFFIKSKMLSKRFCLNIKAFKLKSELNQEILLRVLTSTVNWKANNWFNILRLSVFFSSPRPAGRRHATHKTFSSLFSFNYTLFSFSLSIPRLRAFFCCSVSIPSSCCRPDMKSCFKRDQ